MNWQIKTVLPGTSITGHIFLAPMAGYTDSVFRGLCAEYGADLCYTEMVSCEGWSRLNKKTAELMKTKPVEKSSFSESTPIPVLKRPKTQPPSTRLLSISTAAARYRKS